MSTSLARYFGGYSRCNGAAVLSIVLVGTLLSSTKPSREALSDSTGLSDFESGSHSKQQPLLCCGATERMFALSPFTENFGCLSVRHRRFCVC